MVSCKIYTIVKHRYWSGIDNLLISVGDNGNTGIGGEYVTTSNVSITVVPHNDEIVLSCPTGYVTHEDSDLNITGIAINDDASLGEVYILNYSAQYGSIQLKANNLTLNVEDGGNQYTLISASVSSVRDILEFGLLTYAQATLILMGQACKKFFNSQ